MSENLAIWYLKRKGISVILNCKFNEPVSIQTEDKIYHQNNHYINGTEFLFADGSKYVIQKTEATNLEIPKKTIL